MSNHSEKSILKFLGQHAPKAPLGQSLSIAHDFQSLKDEALYLKEMIAILASFLLNDNGEVKPGYQDLRPAVQFALKEVSNCHAWVVCGPVRDALTKLMDDVEKRFNLVDSTNNVALKSE